VKTKKRVFLEITGISGHYATAAWPGQLIFSRVSDKTRYRLRSVYLLFTFSYGISDIIRIFTLKFGTGTSRECFFSDSPGLAILKFGFQEYLRRIIQLPVKKQRN
jgi:hypothetical protein